MIAKIIIKRRFIEGKERQIMSLLNEIRARAMNQPGYISGETLMHREYPQNMIIITTWQTMEDWVRWKDSEERKKYEAMLEMYQTRNTDYEEYFLGSAFFTKAEQRSSQ